MRNLSLWARSHPAPARMLIIISHLLLAGLAFFIGNTFTGMGLRPPVFLAILFMGVLIIATLCYARPYRRRKICDFLIAASGFCLLCWLTGNPDSLLGGLTPTQAVATIPGTSSQPPSSPDASTIPDSAFRSPTAASILDEFSHGSKKSLTHKEKRILVREFRHQLKVYSQAKKQDTGTVVLKAFLILLAIVAAVGLLALVASLACNISCSGSGALAIVVLLAGATGVVLLFLVALKAITRIGRGKHKKDPPASPEGSL